MRERRRSGAVSYGVLILNIRLLDRLRAVPDEYVPLCELGTDLQQVRDDLTSLVSFGFRIEQHPYRGASYVGHAERLCPDQIEHELATRWIGRRIAVWNRVTSTNDLAIRAGESRSNNGLVVLAEEQTTGRGRHGRSWTAPPRSSILMSILVFPPPHLLSGDGAGGSGGQAWLTALGAIATAEVVSSWIGESARIKWPNDVRVRGRKIAGILVERSSASSRKPGSARSVSKSGWGAAIGIGLNVNLRHEDFPPELVARATSLRIERGGESVDRSDLARDLISRLDHWYDLSRVDGTESLSAAWCQRSEHLGCSVRVSTSREKVVGRFVDLDFRAGITVELDSLSIGPSHNADFPPESGIPGHDSSPDTQRESAVAPERSGSAAGYQVPRLVRLPLADVRSIEAVDECQSSRAIDSDSGNAGSGTVQHAVLD